MSLGKQRISGLNAMPLTLLSEKKRVNRLSDGSLPLRFSFISGVGGVGVVGAEIEINFEQKSDAYLK